LRSYFDSAQLFETYDEALLHAGKMAKEWDDIIEYGIQFIGEYEDFD